MQDINRKQLKRIVKDTFEKDEKITINSEPSNSVDLIILQTKTHLDTELSKVEGHISFIEKTFYEVNLYNDSGANQNRNEVLIEKH